MRTRELVRELKALRPRGRGLLWPTDQELRERRECDEKRLERFDELRNEIIEKLEGSK